MRRRDYRLGKKAAAGIAIAVGIAALLIASAGSISGPSRSAVAAESSAMAASPAQKAVALLDALRRGEMERARIDFSDDLRQRVPTQRLDGVWQGLVKRFGSFAEAGQFTLSRDAGLTIVRVPCRFLNGTVEAKIVFDERDTIVGLFLGEH